MVLARDIPQGDVDGPAQLFGRPCQAFQHHQVVPEAFARQCVSAAKMGAKLGRDEARGFRIYAVAPTLDTAFGDDAEKTIPLVGVGLAQHVHLEVGNWEWVVACVFDGLPRTGTAMVCYHVYILLLSFRPGRRDI